MSLIVTNRSDNFEAWRVNTNQLGANVGDLATLASGISSSSSVVGAANTIMGYIGTSAFTTSASDVKTAINQITDGVSIFHGNKTFANNLSVQGILGSTGNFSVGSSQLTVDASTGDVLVAGTLGVTGVGTFTAGITADGLAIGTTSNTIAVNGSGSLYLAAGTGGSISMGSPVVVPASGTTTTPVISLTNTASYPSTPNRFTIDANGNVAIVGNLSVSGTTTLTSTNYTPAWSSITGKSYYGVMSDGTNTASPITNDVTGDTFKFRGSNGVTTTIANNDGTYGDNLLISLSGVPNSVLSNSSLTVSAGTGLSGGGAVSLGGTVTLSNAGVTSNVAGTGISVSGATGAVTIANTGVLSLGHGNGISLSGSTGAVTITNSDLGSSQNIFKNVAVSGQTTQVATINNDTITLVAGTVSATPGISITTPSSGPSQVTISHATTTAIAGTSTNSGGNVIQNLTLDAYGHVTAIAAAAPTTYIGTTGVALGRASNSLALNGILSVTLPGSTSGSIQLVPTAVAGTGTVITIPATTGTLVTTGDTSTVSSAMLAGSIANSKLLNSSLTLGSTNVSLGGTASSLSGLTSIQATTFTGNLVGNASSASNWASSRTVSFTGGDATGSFSIDGSTNVGSVALTLQSVNSNIGTYGSTTTVPVINVDGKGRILSVSSATISGGGGGGTQGVQGIQGIQGTQGTAGAGTQGTQGAQGIQGTTGSGTQGAQGTSAAGTQGTQGAIGAGTQGTQGRQGITGSQGTTGTGTQGTQGTAGPSANQLLNTTSAPTFDTVNLTSSGGGSSVSLTSGGLAWLQSGIVGPAVIYTNGYNQGGSTNYGLGLTDLSYGQGAKTWLYGNGDASFGGALSKASGSFKINHPLPALSKTNYLYHSFIEGPYCDLIYRGTAVLSAGTTSVNIDSHFGMTSGTFAALCKNCQVFVTNQTDWSGVRGSVSGSTLTISCQDSNATSTVNWMVVGERNDPHIIDTDWTDHNGRPILEPKIPIDPKIA